MNSSPIYLLSAHKDPLESTIQRIFEGKRNLFPISSTGEIPMDHVDRPLLQPIRFIVVLANHFTADALAHDLTTNFSHSPLRELYSVIFVVDQPNLGAITPLVKETDDVITENFSQTEFEQKISLVEKRHIKLKKLSRDLQEASDIALLSMSHSSELGEISRFILNSYNCINYEQLLDALFETIKVFGVRCSALILVDDKMCIREAEDIAPGVAETMLRLHNQKRINHMGADTFISFSHASLLIHDMPIENENHYGRLLDNLTILGNCFEARVKGIHSEEEAQSASRAKTMFLATMSHELRTPMNSVIGFTERLIGKLEGRITEREFKHLNTIKRNGDHLLKIINDILDMSKIEVGLMEIHPEAINAHDLVQNVFNQLQPIAQNAHLDFQLHLDDPSISIHADPTRFTQIVMNLTSNAIKYTEQGSVDLYLNSISDSQIGDGIEVKVQDTGIGISQEDQDRLFGNFVQIDSALTRKVEGTGLGLAISMVFANMHGGRIDVCSEQNKGSSFSLILPLHTAESSKPVFRV